MRAVDGDARILPLHLADVHLPEGERWPADTPFPVVAHAIVHRDGVFLFDTGMGSGNAEVEELFSPERYPIEDALGARGVSMADVTAVANCHLHLDHAGQNGRFPGRSIFVQRREWAMVHEPDYTIAEWVDVPGLSYEVLDGETEVAPGIRVVPTAGHTPGHQSLVVETSAGAVLIAGQAVLTFPEWTGQADETRSGEPPEGRDGREDYAASVRRLRALDPVRVHFVHDPAVWERSA
jgi:glyoxylase-like metal-dependent hydrolase (beta-lactamase superfamily II)